ncbi:hypothetical protein [Stutzerimonas stutzeri]|uniref:hypothetical protein n=1 Tax=Stutzerimonas stutzeri TaxID=316 RepID=UPI003EC0EF51
MKKTLLALAITALSANAFAVDLETQTGTASFASEINVASTGTAIATATPVTASAKLGVTLAKVFVRYDLANGAKFAAAPALTSTNAGPATITLVSGGIAGSSSAIFEVSSTGNATADVLTLAAKTTVVSKEAVGITYGVYETVSNASAQTASLYSKSGTLLNFKSGLEVKAAPAAAIKKIAVGVDGKNFTTFDGAAGANDLTDLTTLTVTPVAGVLAATGNAATVAAAAPGDVNNIISAYNWKLEGDFSAANSLTALSGFTLAANKLSATNTAANVASGTTVTYTVNKTAVIPETAVKATFTPTAAAGYTVAAATFDPAATLVREGTSDSADLALRPNGSYKNFVRISNKSTIAGKFFIEVTNDAGESRTVALNEVAGQASDSLAAGASTTQMDIVDIFAAAAAKGLTLSGEGKLRLKATGQVSNGSVSLQTYTVSKDNNSFATF